ncbi:hypothetical protein BGY98DRAFT_973343 [Russula aff. rugulosa BPL654]|nr:hypothetical protein BGY98DRAFT_973343 [Russula aff. rugulosa BPL654]
MHVAMMSLHLSLHYVLSLSLGSEPWQKFGRVSFRTSESRLWLEVGRASCAVRLVQQVLAVPQSRIVRYIRFGNRGGTDRILAILAL